MIWREKIFKSGNEHSIATSIRVNNIAGRERKESEQKRN